MGCRRSIAKRSPLKPKRRTDGQPIRVAGLASIVGFKRLAGRPQDKIDLTELEAIYGELPVGPIPGLDA